MTAEAPPQAPAVLDDRFVVALLEAFVALAQGDFSVRLPRSGRRDAPDTIAYLANLMAEELGDLFHERQQHREQMEELIQAITDVLVKIGAGEFGARVRRSYDGSPQDVLSYLVNSAAEEVEGLLEEREQKTALLEDQAARQAIAERSAFSTLTAGVGHELNNPLSYAAGNLEYLDRELSDMVRDRDLGRLPELLEAISEAREGVRRAAKIGADLKMLMPANEVRLQSSDVATVVESALALIRNSVAHRARLECRYEPVPAVLVDRGRLGQVVVNLVQNALHALPPQRPTEENLIEIVTRRSAEHRVAIEIRDNGVGIEPENLPRIFESFFTTRKVGEGTGLGLAISKRLVADHGGRIEVESTPGRGSTFRVLLRLAEGAR